MAMRFDAGEVITAMVTPFDKNREIDYDKVESLAKHLISNGSDALLVAGTTGESPTLTHDEEMELLSSVKRAAADKAKVIMNTGSNSTETAVMMTKRVTKEEIADALLCVVPYYNKPSQKGMIAHFSAIAESTNLPIILYNIPSRTGVNILAETVAYLAHKYTNIVALKQSYADMDTVTELKLVCPQDFTIYSGDDSLTLPMMSLGAYGVISVASHIFGKEIKSMIRNFKTGEVAAAKNMHNRLYPSFKKLFTAPNPVPIKAALADKGLMEDYVRRPLVELNDEEKADLMSAINGFYND